MSAFLGPIHHWLYNKIQLQQGLVEDIIGLGERDYQLNLKQELDNRYGISDTSPLEEIIDETNIHGWLQERVMQVERKLAYSIMRLIQVDVQAIEQVEALFAQDGKEKRAALQGENLSAVDLYKEMSNHLLDGMPCDHAYAVLETSENKVVWKRELCVHKPYWDEAGVDIKYYYDLRAAWILGFLSQEGEVFKQVDEVTYSIEKA